VLFFCTVIPGRADVVYEFGPFRLEPKERRLLRGGEHVPLTGKVFDTLTVLIQRHGSLIPKQELMNAVWPEIVVEENNLDRNISTLRKALADDGNGKQFIETVPRVGYRFVAPVKEIVASTAKAQAQESATPALRQEIRFCVARDQVRLAYSRIGSGHPLVKVANCFNHLDYEWESPIWRHWVKDFAKGHSLVRYDGRGNGLSQWDCEDVSFDAWVSDLETVVDAAGLEKFGLLGISQGGAVAVAYAARHPERVSHLILCGGYARGCNHRGRPEVVKIRRALEDLVQVNWGKSNPSFFQLVTSLYIPENATPADQEWFNELQRISVSTNTLVKTMQACDDINVRPILPEIKVPTIVFHSDRDRIAPPEEGRILAAEIPNAKFVPLASGNHLLLGEEAAWKIFRDEVEAFLGGSPDK
jgi:DNA-binding winged helix-turn-helix (wHTH) protein/pimeloyl-ACP methyl ester carboxylesterase